MISLRYNSILSACDKGHAWQQARSFKGLSMVTRVFAGARDLVCFMKRFKIIRPGILTTARIEQRASSSSSFPNSASGAGSSWECQAAAAGQRGAPVG